MKPVQKSVLLSTSSKTSLTYSNGVFSVAGVSFRKSDIRQLRQLKYKAEVAQVYTVGGLNTVSGVRYTPTASTTYTVTIYDPRRKTNGNTQGVIKFSYTTPPTITDIGATAALQREHINLQLVAAINAATNTVSATAATLTGGNGFTITDNGDYYPPRTQGGPLNYGANTVGYITNSDGTGFINGDIDKTTDAVYSFGVGADLVSDVAVVDGMFGNFTSGLPAGIAIYNFPAPVNTSGTAAATSGQNYDGFLIDCLELAPAHQQTGQLAYNIKQIMIFVDNGTGSSTTNLDGFKAFERQMRKLMWELWSSDPKTLGEFFDSPIVFQDPLGAAPSGTADILGWQLSNYTAMNRTNIGTQTIVAPVLDSTGLLIDQDDTAGDGSHTSANQQTLGGQEFTVGTDEFSVFCRVVAADWTDTQFMVGFRKKAVYTANYNDYTDLAAIGGGAADGDSITTQGILNNAATVATDTGVNFADGVSIDLWIKVALDGTVTAYANGVSYPIYSVGTTTLVLDAGDVMIPFYQHVNIGNGNPAISISQVLAVASTNVIS